MCAKRSYIYKVIIAGDGFVGKTSIILRLTRGIFLAEYIVTLGSNFALWKTKCEDAEISLQLWDVAGQPYFRKVLPSYYEGAHGAILVYSLVDPSSLQSIPRWYNEIKNVAGDIPFIVLGNKNDLDRNVPEDYARAIAEQLNCAAYFEVSAKTGHNIQKAFEEVARILYNHYKTKMVM